jgi:hypothetical protein
VCWKCFKVVLCLQLFLGRCYHGVTLGFKEVALIFGVKKSVFHTVWVCCMACVLPVAYADSVAVVVRGGSAAAEKAAQQLSYHMHEEIRKDTRHTVVSLEEALGNPDLDRIRAAFQTALEAKEKARVAYDALDLDSVVQELSDALSKWDRYPAYVVSFKDVLEAHLLLGAAYVLRGEEQLGVKKFEQVVVMSPHTEPDPRVFNPSMRQLYAQAQTRVANRRRGVLSVTSVPVAAEVYVDNQFVGITPVALQGVVEGKHGVVVRKDGYRGWGRSVDVQGAAETVETAQLRMTTDEKILEEASAALTGDLEDSQARTALAALSAALKVARVYYMRVDVEEEWLKVSAVLFDAQNKRVIRKVSHALLNRLKPEAYRREVADFAQKLSGQSKETSASVEEKKGVLPKPVSENEIPHSNTWKKKVFLYGLVGAGGALVVTGGVLWGLAKHNQNQFRDTFQTSQEAANKHAAGKSMALVGDVAAGLGAAAVLTGLAMYFFWNPSPSKTTASLQDQPVQRWAVSGMPAQGGGSFYATLHY